MCKAVNCGCMAMYRLSFISLGTSVMRPPLIAGVCLVWCFSPISKIEAYAVPFEHGETHLLAQQTDSDRIIQLIQEGDQLREEGSSNSLLRAISLYEEALIVSDNLDTQQ